MAKPDSYWDKRAIKRLTDAEKQSEAYIKRIQKVYDQANKNIQRDIENVYRNYSKATGLDVQSLKTLLTKTETEKLWEELRRQGLDKYVKGNYKARISRLEKIQAQIYAKAKSVYTEEQLQHTMCYEGVINKSYYKAIYDTQMGTGFDFAFANIDDNMVSALLNERWSGKNYSQRIWGNTDILAESLSQIVGGAMISGQSIEKTSRQIRERFDVAKYYADRLVRTETNHFNNEADAMAYEEMDVDKYVFIATLDTRTSTMCQNLDNHVFKLSERQVGVNYPPMHPLCRSKTRAYMGAEIEATLKRRARNPVTGKNENVDNMSYEEWYNAKVKEHGKDDVDKAFKMAGKNTGWVDAKTYADQQQYARYVERLGDKSVGTFDNFRKIKYNDDTAYQEIVGYYRYKGNVPEATKKDFATAKAIKQIGVKGSVRVPPLPTQRAYILEDKASRRDPAHIMKRMMERHITDDEVQSYVDNAIFSVSQFKGTRRVFYSKDGVTVLTKTSDYGGVEWIAKTTWNKTDFDEHTEKLIKEAMRNGE